MNHQTYTVHGPTQADLQRTVITMPSGCMNCGGDKTWGIVNPGSPEHEWRIECQACNVSYRAEYFWTAIGPKPTKNILEHYSPEKYKFKVER